MSKATEHFFIENGNYTIINRHLKVLIGRDEADIYFDLLGKQKYFEERGMLTIDGFFYNTVDDVYADTLIGERPQAKAIKSLVKWGLIEQENRGMPNKRYFKVNDNLEHIQYLLEEGAKQYQELKDKLKEKMEFKKGKSKTNHNKEYSSVEMKEQGTANSRNMLRKNAGEIKLNNKTKNKNKNGMHSKEMHTTCSLLSDIQYDWTKIDHYKTASVFTDCEEAVKDFYNLYEYYLEKKHPKLKVEQLERIYTVLCSFMNEQGLDTSMMYDMAQQYFRTNIKCDHNLNHFATPGVLEHRYYEAVGGGLIK